MKNYFQISVITLVFSTLLISGNVTHSATAFDYVSEIEAGKFTVWHPEVLLAGSEYDFLLIYEGFTEEELSFDVFTDNQGVIKPIENQITIGPGMSHGMAKFKAVNPGTANIFTVIEGKVFEREIEVIRPALSATQLEIIVPEEGLQIQEMPVYVILRDDFGNPVITFKDVQVNLSTFGNIESDITQITIPDGSHYSNFLVKVKGDGGITAAAPNLDSVTKMIEIEREDDEPELRVRVAPNPLAPSSVGQVYIWLETPSGSNNNDSNNNDSNNHGEIVIPQEDIEVTLSSQDDNILTFSKTKFNKAPDTQALESTITITLEAGQSFAKTLVYSTDFISEFSPDFNIPDSITIATDENGEVTDEGIILAVSAIADGYEGKQTDVNIKLPLDEDPVFTQLWAYPNPAVDDFEVVIAAYTNTTTVDRTTDGSGDNDNDNNDNDDNDNDDRETGSDAEGDEDEELDNICDECVPVLVVEGDLMGHVSGGELVSTKVSSAPLFSSSHIKQENYVVIPGNTKGIVGDTSVSGVIDGTEGHTINMDVEQPFSEEPKISILPIPIIANSNQDLFMIYQTEQSAITNPDFDEVIITTKPEIEITEIRDDGPFKVVKGIAYGEAKVLGDIDITVLASGIESAQDTIELFDPDARGLKVDHPTFVHAGEPFPYVIYATDSDNNPIGITEASVSPQGFFTDKGHYKTAISTEEIEEFVIFKDGYEPTYTSIEVFGHPVQLELVSSIRSQYNIADSFTLLYNTSPENATVTLDTELNYEEIPGGFEIFAFPSGNHEVIMRADYPNYVTGVFSKDVRIIDPLATEFETGEYSNLPLGVALPLVIEQNLPFLIIMITAASGGGGFIWYKKKNGQKDTNVKKLDLDDDLEEDLTF